MAETNNYPLVPAGGRKVVPYQGQTSTDVVTQKDVERQNVKNYTPPPERPYVRDRKPFDDTVIEGEINEVKEKRQDRKGSQAADKTSDKVNEAADKFEFITDKFSKNLEEIGKILKTSVEGQGKAFKADLDKVNKTYSSFIEASKNQKAALDKADEEQKKLFKELTQKFIDYREDEHADSQRFHTDLLEVLKALHSVGGNEDAMAAIEGLIRQGLASSRPDPDAERLDKKWQLSDKEKEHWSFKLFGEKKQPPPVSPEDAAVASGKAERLSKDLFKDRQEGKQKSPVEKALESIAKNIEKTAKQAEKGEKQNRPAPEKVVADVIKKEADTLLDKKLLPRESEGESFSDLRKKSIETEDVEFREVPEPTKRDVAVKQLQPIEAKTLALPAPRLEPVEVEKPSEALRLTHREEPVQTIEPVQKATEPVQVRKKTTIEPVQQVVTPPKRKPLAEAVSAAVREVKPPIARPSKTIAQVAQPSKTIAHVVKTPKTIVQVAQAPTAIAQMVQPSKTIAQMAQAPVVNTLPALLPAEKSAPTLEPVQQPVQEERSGVGDLIPAAAAAAFIPGKGKILGKVGSLLGKAGKFAGKIAAPLAAGSAVAGGISDIASGGKVESLSDIIPKGGLLDKLNPFEYASNAGRYVGDKINTAIGSGGESLGSRIYDFLNPSDTAKNITPTQPTASKIAPLTEQVNKAKAEENKPVAPTIIQTGGASSQPQVKQTTNYLPVTAGGRTRENAFDKALSKSYTAI